MKLIQQVVVVVCCFFVGTALAQDETYDLVIMVSMEPEPGGGDENSDIYIDQLITEVDQAQTMPESPGGLVQGGVSAMPGVVAGEGFSDNETRPHLHMKMWSEDPESAVKIQCCVGTQ